MAKPNRIKFKELRQGVTVYTVHAFGPNRGTGWVKKERVAHLPVLNESIRSYFVFTAEKKERHINRRERDMIFIPRANKHVPKIHKGFFTGDQCIPSPAEKTPRRLSFHSTFRTPRAAHRYLDRINRGCFTADEQKRYEEMLERDEWNKMFDSWSYPLYEEDYPEGHEPDPIPEEEPVNYEGHHDDE